jgi:hypothetical protein
MVNETFLYRDINIALNIVTSLIILALILGSIKNKIKTQSLNKLYIPLMAATLMSSLCDLFGYVANGNPDLRTLTVFFNGAFYILNFVVLSISAKYLFECLSYKTDPPRQILYLVDMACLTGIIIAVVNFFNPILFIVNEDGVYNRINGVVFGTTQILGLMCMAICAAVLIHCRRAFGKTLPFFILGYTIIPIGSLVIQALVYGVTLTNISTMVFGLIMYINANRELSEGMTAANEFDGKKIAAALQSKLTERFLFSTMIPLRDLIAHDPDNAYEAVNRLFEFEKHSQINAEEYSLISIDEEMGQVRSYAELIKLRGKDRITFVFETSPSDIKIPPMTIIPLIDNAAAYGAAYREHTVITVKTFSEGKNFVITIEDDGEGFDTDTLKDIKKSIWAVSERLLLLCGGTLLINSKPGSGTTARIKL